MIVLYVCFGGNTEFRYYLKAMVIGYCMQNQYSNFMYGYLCAKAQACLVESIGSIVSAYIIAIEIQLCLQILESTQLLNQMDENSY